MTYPDDRKEGDNPECWSADVAMYVAGGILFDPLGLSASVESFEDMKVKEIKNGRLAMVAWVAWFAQVRAPVRVRAHG